MKKGPESSPRTILEEEKQYLEESPTIFREELESEEGLKIVGENLKFILEMARVEYERISDPNRIMKRISALSGKHGLEQRNNPEVQEEIAKAAGLAQHLLEEKASHYADKIFEEAGVPLKPIWISSVNKLYVWPPENGDPLSSPQRSLPIDTKTGESIDLGQKIQVWNMPYTDPQGNRYYRIPERGWVLETNPRARVAVRVTEDNLKIRQEPTRDSNIVGKLSQGQEILLDANTVFRGKKFNWSRAYGLDGQELGYVATGPASDGLAFMKRIPQDKAIDSAVAARESESPPHETN